MSIQVELTINCWLEDNEVSDERAEEIAAAVEATLTRWVDGLTSAEVIDIEMKS